MLAINGIGNLVMHTNDELFDELVKRLLVELNKSADSKEKLRTLIQCVGALRYVHGVICGTFFFYMV